MALFARIEPELRRLAARFQELEDALQDPAVAGDPGQLTAVLKERGQLEGTVRAFEAVLTRRQEIADTEAELASSDDPEMTSLCQEILDDHRASLPPLEEALLNEFVRDEEEHIGRVIVEVRAGTGGDEATLWAGELLRMYEAFASRRGWKSELLELYASEADGVREATLAVEGQGSWAGLRFESGGHRVQRVPVTETQGRIHTSAATVAVLPEPEAVEVEVREADLRIDTYRASGAGGQHVNKTSSAIRITHEPTGLVVTCQDEKSQHKNKARALRILRTRLFDQERQRLHAERSSARKSLIGSGDRSERIRTYNFPQSRVTDHRINFTTHDLAGVLAGDLEALCDALAAADREQRLAALFKEQ